MGNAQVDLRFYPPVIGQERLGCVFAEDDWCGARGARNDGWPRAEIGEVDCQGEEDEVEGGEDCDTVKAGEGG